METQAANPASAADSEIERRIAVRLGQLRTERGWSLEDVAERTGISRATLSRLERSELSPTAAMLGALCTVYGWTLSRLMADAETPPPNLHSRRRSRRTGRTPRPAIAAASFRRRRQACAARWSKCTFPRARRCRSRRRRSQASSITSGCSKAPSPSTSTDRQRPRCARATACATSSTARHVSQTGKRAARYVIAMVRP